MQTAQEHKSLNILLVEDVELHCEVYAQMIRMDNPDHKVDVCMDGISAVEVLRNKADDYDCLLLDLHLPDMDGFEIAQITREKSDALPIIFITADEDEKKAMDALSVGAQDYLLKGEHGHMMLMRSIRYAMERKRFEIETNQLKENLEQQKQLYIKQREFSSLVSHEFRTPIALMSSSLQMLERKIKKGEAGELNKYTKKLHAAIKRLTHLMDSALSYSKMEEGKMRFAPTQVNIRAMIEGLVQDFETLYPDMTVQCELSTLPETIFADEALCDHVFSNLISNAIKYSRGLADHISLCAHVDEDYIHICIEDYGRGIGASELKHIGERFYRGKNTDGTSGSGIGIYITKNILQMHNGSLAYESEIDKGTVATATLPIKDMRK